MSSPPQPLFNDYYQALGVQKTATREDIKRAFRRLAKIHHPDKQGAAAPSDAHDFRKIREAHDVLTDDLKRPRYDRQYETVQMRQKAYREEQEAQRQRKTRSTTPDDEPRRYYSFTTNQFYSSFEQSSKPSSGPPRDRPSNFYSSGNRGPDQEPGPGFEDRYGGYYQQPPSARSGSTGFGGAGHDYFGTQQANAFFPDDARQQAEFRRHTEEMRQAQAIRQAEAMRQARAQSQARQAEAIKQFEARRQAEAQRRAEEQRAAEIQRQAEAQQAAEAQRVADIRRSVAVQRAA
ncbi:DnaJ-domain-containing protein [Microthyrium microscopicum]|uniref:DnaJ-domain-containing protein n=1 Tax=Microthyrium microscopicum TaxID=703497 RepID=A0A6A6U5Q7_9PEZI|nr:DnaJ-domain-containing protein [Microthyrium microscopicum]